VVMGGYANFANSGCSGVFSGRDNCSCSAYTIIMFGTQHCTNDAGGNVSDHSASLGGLFARIEGDRYGFIGAAQHTYLIQGGSDAYNVNATGNYLALYYSTCTALMTLGTGNYYYYGDCAIFSNIYKTTNNFKINHPDPSKCDTTQLWHTTVESPTRGDTLYRYDVNVIDCNARVELPDYFKHLNECPQVWVTPNNGFGNAYGTFDNTLSHIDICTDTDGCYSALVLATRKDCYAKRSWDGVEEAKRTQLDIK
jgi:hypothetical protein